MTAVDRLSLVPKTPAVYALMGGPGYVAYVGIAGQLRRRLEQHLEHRNSSISTGASATGLNPEFVTEVRWWQDPLFDDQAWLAAAELVALDVLDPALRSRGHPSEAARAVVADPASAARLRTVLDAPASGRFVRPTLQDALDRIANLEARLTALEERLDG